jgi:hypothetical protein
MQLLATFERLAEYLAAIVVNFAKVAVPAVAVNLTLEVSGDECAAVTGATELPMWEWIRKAPADHLTVPVLALGLPL